MLIIPVIDLSQGQVIHAVKGQRDYYRPIQSHLCHSSEAVKIISAYLGLYPFNLIYVADLDAINGMGDNSEIIKRIQDVHPQLNIWLDSGISKLGDYKTNQASKLMHVIGSETGINKDELYSLKNACPEFILSLDFSEKVLIGDPEILESPDVWPDIIINMTLNRVGSKSGPDLERLCKTKAIAPLKRVFAAGGIRNRYDLQRLEDIDVAGALIATALHTQDITSKEIKAMMSKVRT